MNAEKIAHAHIRDLDFIEELKLRRWAREHHVPPSERQRTWHPIVHDEMNRKDSEFLESRRG